MTTGIVAEKRAPRGKTADSPDGRVALGAQIALVLVMGSGIGPALIYGLIAGVFGFE